ncbi:Phenylacetic acid catabolic protein [Bacillus sp. V33-4]|uniref:Phenylacetic acid catabolic protein n=1 Tax=Bacillus sp. V33-4 TaxID=2054169 RepID=UPI000C793DCE|nr:Phenylacetic acid catabolic protein [Bacillus sp. V33-4]PLR81232.1 phenylacetic acid catabolism protein [Bacillus sp. V33-4]
MAQEKNISLIELAETIADNKFILGDRLVEIGISGPDLEATLSSIAMAQAELGHARLIYKWSFELKGLNSSKVDIKHQTGKAFQNGVDISDWISLIAGQYTINLAVDLVMKAIIEADNTAYNPPFSKLLKEQDEHLTYSRSWCEQLLNEKGSIPKRFEHQLEKAALEAEQWLTKVEADYLLLSEKIIAENNRLTTKFKNKIKELTMDEVVSNV